MLIHILKMYEQGHTIAGIARYIGSNWPRMQRWIARAVSIREWLQKECGNALSVPTSAMGILYPGFFLGFFTRAG